MKFIEVRLSKLLQVFVGREGKAKSARLSVFHSFGLLPVILIVGLLVMPAVRTDATSNPAAELQAQLCPLLDDLTEASISMATQDRSTASAQMASVVSLTEGMLSTVQSPEMTSMLGKSAKTLQKALARFQGRIAKAKLFLDEPAITDTAAFRAMQTAISEGQRLRKAMLQVPSSDTVIAVRETGTRAVALHSSGNTVCFHVDVLSDTNTPSCGPANVSVTILNGDPSKTVIAGSPSFNGPADFCLTMGPDAGTIRVSVTMCGQPASLLLYNAGVLTKPGHAPKPGRAPRPPSNLAVMMVTQTSITLNWQDNSNDETGFHIERALAVVGPWGLAGTVEANVTSFSDNGLVAGTTYFYRVSAFN
jgi:hypothetical protein